MTPLTKKQRIFVKEYLVDSNATRAAKAAGYSKASATVIGSRLLTNVKVRAAIGT
jgi:phage terminase small subunit